MVQKESLSAKFFLMKNYYIPMVDVVLITLELATEICVHE